MPLYFGVDPTERILETTDRYPIRERLEVQLVMPVDTSSQLKIL